jgi:hypothetical protein
MHKFSPFSQYDIELKSYTAYRYLVFVEAIHAIVRRTKIMKIRKILKRLNAPVTYINMTRLSTSDKFT